MVRQRFAKPSHVGPNPPARSKLKGNSMPENDKDYGLITIFFSCLCFGIILVLFGQMVKDIHNDYKGRKVKDVEARPAIQVEDLKGSGSGLTSPK